MTFTKLAYISVKNLDEVRDLLQVNGFEDQVSWHQDGEDSNEIWVCFDSDSIDLLNQNGFVSDHEKEEISLNEADTILFY